MAVGDEQPFSDLEATLKKAASALREAGVPFLLGGSLASWARGGPETRHDLDLMLKHSDAERALDALVQVGMRPERPPENWLLKAWDEDVLVDLIYWPSGMAIDDDVLARGEELSVLGMEMQVMALEDVVVTKLRALTEHALRYESLLAISRSLREQIDWAQVRRRTQESPYARAFFVLLEGLDIIEPGTAMGDSDRGVNVRVITPGHEAGTGRFDAADAG